MSYILDALKKADRDRHPVAVPTLATAHRTPASSRRRLLWPWIVGAVIVVNAGVWLWLLRPAPSVPDGALVSMSQAPATSPAPAAPEQAAPARPVEPVTTPESPDKTVVAVAPSQAPPSATRSAPSVPLSRREQNLVAAPRAATKSARVTSAGAAAPRSASPPKPESALEKSPAPAVVSATVKPLERDPATPPASQEPPVPQEVIAKLHLQVLVYSEAPSGRLVFINNHKYVEGQRIDANLVVERITSDGVFVSYQDKRVFLRAEQSTSR
jgi:general secretion pathway protein B